MRAACRRLDFISPAKVRGADMGWQQAVKSAAKDFVPGAIPFSSGCNSRFRRSTGASDFNKAVGGLIRRKRGIATMISSPFGYAARKEPLRDAATCVTGWELNNAGLT